MAPVQIWAMGLAMPLPAMSGAEPCTGSNIDGYSFSGLMLPPGAIPIEPGDGRAEIGEDVAEEVRRHHHVEPVRVLDEVGGQDVDVELVGLHVRVFARRSAAKRSSQNGML